MQDYLEWKRATTKNPNTPQNYERWVKRFLTFLGDEPITLEGFMRFRDHLRPIYSPKNVQYGSYLVRDYIAYQVTVHDLNFPLRLIKITQERSQSHDAISREEFAKMLAFLPKNEPVTLQRRLMLTLLWETGMRVGELTRLKMSDLKENGAIINNEKNHRSRRIGWSNKTEELLKFYLPLRKGMMTKKEDAAGNDWLFVSLKWKPSRKLSTRQIERIVEDLRKKAELKTLIRPHSFRHGFVHRQLEKRTPITTIAQMLGHTSTMNVLNYAQLNSQEIQEAWKM